jgi:hypothetical protein
MAGLQRHNFHTTARENRSFGSEIESKEKERDTHTHTDIQTCTPTPWQSLKSDIFLKKGSRVEVWILAQNSRVGIQLNPCLKVKEKRM